MKVIELVSAHIAYGWSPEELHFQFPYLTLGQIYSALAYYWDHQDELDHEIERRLAFTEQMHRSIGETPLEARLKAKGLIYCPSHCTWITMYRKPSLMGFDCVA
jgi:hypothetical protein